MFGPGKRWLGAVTAVGLVAGCAGLFHSTPPTPADSEALPPTYAKALTIGSGTEWRFRPLAVDLNRDGHLDLEATARLAKPALQRWLGDGKGNFTPTTPTWTDIGYAALATGDINGDGFPDIAARSHFGPVRRLPCPRRAEAAPAPGYCPPPRPRVRPPRCRP